jgi:predicted RNase H-like HicB family nuclease
VVWAKRDNLLAATIPEILDLSVRIMRQVVISRGEDSYWVAECPSLPGCISQGRTREDAIENIKEAIVGYIAALSEDGLPVPEDYFDTLVVAV